jgi:hypothetical protein
LQREGDGETADAERGEQRRDLHAERVQQHQRADDEIDAAHRGAHEPVTPMPSARRSPAAAASAPSTPAIVNVADRMIAASRIVAAAAPAGPAARPVDRHEEPEDDAPQDRRQPDRRRKRSTLGWRRAIGAGRWQRGAEQQRDDG